MTTPLTALVAGAEGRSGLAVIRGLGRAGVRVIACGESPRSLGFYSRFVTDRHVCASPLDELGRARHELLSLVKRVRPDVVIPVTQPMLSALGQIRADVESIAALAAPPPGALEYALDASLVMRLGERLGVPVPRSVDGASAAQILSQVDELRFPLMLSSRGPRGEQTPQRPVLVRTTTDLRNILERVPSIASVLVQEFIPGVGVGVTAVCERGDPIALFQYRRTREYPATGGTAVSSQSEPVDARVREYASTLLAATEWHGLAHLQFRHDRRINRLTLLRVQAHFPGATGLSLDTGLNLPYLVALLHAERPMPATGSYRHGVQSRWLRGDLEALSGSGRSVWRTAWWPFLRDFRWGVRHDEFTWNDWKPGVVEFASLARLTVRLLWRAGARLMRRATRPLAALRAGWSAEGRPARDSLHA